jgi:hypothetical protein
MATQSGSVSADQWVVAIGSGLGSLASIGGAVVGYRIFRSEKAEHITRIDARDALEAKVLKKTRDPKLTQDAMAAIDPATMSTGQMNRTVNRYVKENAIVPLPAVKEARKFGLTQTMQGHQLEKAAHQKQGYSSLAVIAEVED